MDKQRLQKLAGIITESVKNSLNEAKIMVKGKMVEEPEKFIIRCYKEPNDMVRQSSYGNLKKGDYLVQTSPVSFKGTNDINKSTVYNNQNKMSYGSRSDRAVKVFQWNLVKKTEKFEMGDFFEPLPVNVKVTKTVTITK